MVMHHSTDSIGHSPDNTADYCADNKAWMKITGPAAATLGDVLCGSNVVVQPKMKAAEGENQAKAHKGDLTDSRQTVEAHSVNVAVYNSSVSVEHGPGAERMKPQTASKIFIKGKDGDQRCIKVLRAYRIVLLGEAGSGKSTLGNTLLGEDVFKPDRTTEYHIQSKSVHERRITVLDTPGFPNADQTEVDLKDEIARCTTRLTPGPHVFLIVLKVEKSSKQSSAVIDKICQCFPEEALKYAAVVFTHGENLPKRVKIEQYINENQHLKDLVTKCSGRYHVADHKYSPGDDTNNSQVSQLLSVIEEIVRENKGGCYTNNILKSHRRDEENTKSGDPNQSDDSTGNVRLWVNFSGSEGSLVAEAFFGSAVVVWQKMQRSLTETTDECPATTSKNPKNKANSEEKNASPSQEKCASIDRKTSVKEGKEAATDFRLDKEDAPEKTTKSGKQDTDRLTDPGKVPRETEENKTQKRGKRQGGGSGFIGNMLGTMLGGAAVVTGAGAALSQTAGFSGMAVGGAEVAIGVAEALGGAAGAQTAATGVGGAAAAESVATDVGGAAAAESVATDVGGAAGAKCSTISTGAALKIATGIGSVAAVGWVGVWVKEKIQLLIHLYRLIKANIGVFLLVVAFFFLLFLSFCARVAGSIVLSCGVLVMFVVILLLLIAMME